MKKCFLTILSLFISLVANSQSDSALFTRLYKPFVNCETVAFNSQEILPEYEFTQTNEINQVLSIWENKCGKVEPLYRLKILLGIKQNTITNIDYEDYITYYFNTYKNRVSASNKQNYNENYEYYKSYYSYVPLRSEFDRWTKTIAENLLAEQKKGTNEYLFCLLFSEQIDLFYKEMKSKEIKDNIVKTITEKIEYEKWQFGFIYNLIIGTWIPMGKLSNTFGLSPNFGLRVGLKYSQHRTTRLDFGFNIRFHSRSKPFEINADDVIKNAKGTTSVTAGLWFTKEYKLKNKIIIDAIGGLGFNLINTDIKMLNQNSENNETDYYSISTADVSLGVNIRRRIFKRNSVGLNLSYHIAPYNLDKKLINKIGSQFITTNIIFSL